jgi:type IV secretion system protein VirB6
MLIVFALVLTLFLTQTSEAILATISENDEIGMAAIKVLAFYALGFFFFLQIPMLAASLGGGGPALANQFAAAIGAAGGFVIGRGASGAKSQVQAGWRGLAREVAKIRTSGAVSQGST